MVEKPVRRDQGGFFSIVCAAFTAQVHVANYSSE